MDLAQEYYIVLRTLMKLTQIKSNIGFCGGGKPEYPEKNLSELRVENQQTQPTYDAEFGNWPRATLVGGEYSHQSGQQLQNCIPVGISLLRSRYSGRHVTLLPN